MMCTMEMLQINQILQTLNNVSYSVSSPVNLELGGDFPSRKAVLGVILLLRLWLCSIQMLLPKEKTYKSLLTHICILE